MLPQSTVTNYRGYSCYHEQHASGADILRVAVAEMTRNISIVPTASYSQTFLRSRGYRLQEMGGTSIATVLLVRKVLISRAEKL